LKFKKNEKKKAEIEKQEMLRLLAKDKEERFGKKFDPNTGKAEVEKQVDKFESVSNCVKSIKTLYPTFRAGDTAKTCFTTIKVLIANILKNPSEEKFKKVKVTNPNFQERLGKIALGMRCLDHLGFKADGEFYLVDAIDSNLFNKTVNLLEEELKSYN